MAAFSRYPDTMMGNKAYGRGRNAPMVDLAHGAQNGLLQDWPGYISNTPYVRRNLIIKVLAGPRGFNLLPEPKKWFQTLKAVLELHPETVEGFNSTLEIETRDVSFSGDGNRQESVSNVTRARVEPVFSYVEKYGRPFAHFFERWVTELIMDPVTKYPGVTNRASARGQEIDLLPDFTSATIIAFEPDPAFRKVDRKDFVPYPHRAVYYTDATGRVCFGRNGDRTPLYGQITDFDLTPGMSSFGATSYQLDSEPFRLEAGESRTFYVYTVYDPDPSTPISYASVVNRAQVTTARGR